MGASTEAENESGEKPADLIDPDCKELAKLFETGCVWRDTKWAQETTGTTKIKSCHSEKQLKATSVQVNRAKEYLSHWS